MAHLNWPTGALAQSWNGTQSTNWFDAGNWTPSGVPNATLQVTIDTITPNPTVVSGGAAQGSSISAGESPGATGNVTVTGSSSRLEAPSNLNLGINNIFFGANGAGTLVIQNGGQVTGSGAVLGINQGSSGVLTVSGAGSSFSLTGQLTVGNDGKGTFMVQNGGLANIGREAFIGQNHGNGEIGSLVVAGMGSRFTSSFLSVGHVGAGTLLVQNGGVVANGGMHLGFDTPGLGNAMVTGSGSKLNTDEIILGHLGAGTLTVQDGGLVSANRLILAQTSGGNGTSTVNIGAAEGSVPAGPGTLSVPGVMFGDGHGKLVFNHTSANYTFLPLILGPAGTVLILAGTTNLASGNLYLGNTLVNGGTLLVNGSIASSALTTVNAGGTLGGTGIVGNITINGGKLAPGNSIGTLTVQGNLIFTTASTYLVEVDRANSDRTNVVGTATLGGATVSAFFAPGSYINKKHTILNATGGVIGRFGALTKTNLPSNYSASLAYDPNDVFLDLTLSFAPPPNIGGGLNGNQQSVANALINSFNTQGGIPLVFGTLSPQGLTQVAGEAATGVQQVTFNVTSMFLGTLTDPATSAGNTTGGSAQGPIVAHYADEALGYAGWRTRNPAEREAYANMMTKAPVATPFERRWSVWGAGYGGTWNTHGNAAAGTANTSARIAGGAAGLDYRLGANTIVGFSLGGAGTNHSLADGLGGGRSEMFQAGVYGRYYEGASYLAGALAYGWQDVTTNRIALLNSYRANFDANAFSGRLEGGWRYAFGASGLTPHAAGQFTTFYLPGFAEQTVAGVNTFALAYAGKNVTASRSELGLRADTSFAGADAIVTLRSRVAWAHNFNTSRATGAIFQTLPASAFTINGAAQASDSALVSAGAEARWLNGWSIAATFEGEFSRVTDSYAGKGVLRYEW